VAGHSENWFASFIHCSDNCLSVIKSQVTKQSCVGGQLSKRDIGLQYVTQTLAEGLVMERNTVSELRSSLHEELLEDKSIDGKLHCIIYCAARLNSVPTAKKT
jgi:hypothetical protein